MIQLNKMPPPPHTGDHTACSKPNPPWWCDEAPNTTIDMGIGILLLLGIILGLWHLKKKNKNRNNDK